MNFTLTQRFLDSLLDYGLAGTDCAVFKDGKPVFRYQNGFANIEAGRKIDDHTLYQLYSNTKVVTCVAAMQQYEQGKFLMDDPVSLYLPAFANMRVLRRMENGEVSPEPAHHDPRVGEMLSMTAGLEYNLEAPSLQALYASRPGFTTREFAEALAQEPLVYHPGEHWLYSLAHDVLAALVEVWSGMRFSEYCRRYIFEPLGMEHSWFHVPEAEQANRADRYPFVEGVKPTKAMPYENQYQRSENHDSGGAGLNATVDDYVKIAEMLTHLGKAPGYARILGSRTVLEMNHNVLHGAPLADFQFYSSRAGYGYGWGVRTMMDPAAGASPSCVGEFGWSGAAGTYVLSDPEAGVSIFYAQQSWPGTNNYVHRRLRNLIYQALED